MAKSKLMLGMALVSGLLMLSGVSVFGNSTAKGAIPSVSETKVQQIISAQQSQMDQPQIVHEFLYGISKDELGLGVDAGPRRLSVYDGRFYILDECNYRIVIWDGTDTIEMPLKEAEILQDMYVDSDGITVMYGQGNVVTYADPAVFKAEGLLNAGLEASRAVEVAQYNIGVNECYLGMVWSDKVLLRYEELMAVSTVENTGMISKEFTLNGNYQNIIENTEVLPDEIYTSLLQVDIYGNRYYRGMAIISIDSEMLIEISVWKVAPNGEILGSVLIDTELMVYFPLEYVAVDTDGTVYVLECRKDKVVIKQYPLQTDFVSKLSTRYLEREKIQQIEMKSENNGEIELTALVTSKTRTDVISTADMYVNYKWNVLSGNLYPETDAVPWYLKNALMLTDVATVTGIPYCYGHSDSITTFNTRKANGYYTGYTWTDATKPNTTGVDCSGYVAQCYGNDYHGTSVIMSYYAEITQSQLCKGDFIVGRTVWGAPSNHVRLFYQINNDGTWVIYESTNANKYDRTVQRAYSASTFATGYKYGTAWTTGHQYSYQYNSSSHWLYCANDCNLKKNTQTHTMNKYSVYNQLTHRVYCSTCSYYVTSSHTWSYSTNGSVRLRTCNVCGYTESY